jgi:hypothetical protein
MGNAGYPRWCVNNNQRMRPSIVPARVSCQLPVQHVAVSLASKALGVLFGTAAVWSTAVN